MALEEERRTATERAHRIGSGVFGRQAPKHNLCVSMPDSIEALWMSREAKEGSHTELRRRSLKGGGQTDIETVSENVFSELDDVKIDIAWSLRAFFLFRM